MSIDEVISFIFSVSVLIYVIQTSRYIKYLKEQNSYLLKDIEVVSKLYQGVINSYNKDNKKEEQESDEERQH